MNDPHQTSMGGGSALETARLHDRERFFCALFASASARPAIFALLALNHELGGIAEKVSEPIVGQIRLAWWREAIAVLGEGEVRSHPLVGELAYACRGRRLNADLLGELVEAREAEFASPLGADINSLTSHARATSGALHRAMMAAIDPATDKEALVAAEQVGTAWGLVGALRSLRFHAGSSGRFAALADLDKPAVREAAEEICRRAGVQISEGRRAAAKITRTQLAPLLPAVMIEDYLQRLERAQFDPFEARLDRGQLRRRLAVLAAWIWRRW